MHHKAHILMKKIAFLMLFMAYSTMIGHAISNISQVQ